MWGWNVVGYPLYLTFSLIHSSRIKVCLVAILKIVIHGEGKVSALSLIACRWNASNGSIHEMTIMSLTSCLLLALAYEYVTFISIYTN